MFKKACFTLGVMLLTVVSLASADRCRYDPCVDIDNIEIDGNTISSSAGDINITPFADSQVVLDTKIEVDNGTISTNAGDLSLTPLAGQDVVIDSHYEFDLNLLTGITDADSHIVPYAGKAFVVDNYWDFDGSILTALTDNDLAINAYAGKAILLDGHWDFDGAVLTAMTDNNTTITAYTGKNITIESVTFDGGVVGGITTLGAAIGNFTGVVTVSPDGTNEVLQVNDGTIDYTDGAAGTTGTATIDSSGNISYNKNIAATDLDGIIGSNTPAAITGTTITTSGAADMTIANGNLVIGTSGKGIDFSATADVAGMTSELLDDYEEGLWTPVPSDAATAGNVGTFTANASYQTYTKSGRNVHVQGFIQSLNTTGMTAGNDLFIQGLPFVTVTSQVSGSCSIGNATLSGAWVVPLSPTGSHFTFAESVTGGPADNLIVSEFTSTTAIIAFTLDYITN